MKKHTALEFRYYNMPMGSYILPLYGDSWRREYGWDTGDTQHFHNYFELGFCHEGKGEVRIEDRVLPYGGGMYTMIPAHIPHTTKSASGNQCYWEYLFVDIDGSPGGDNDSSLSDDCLRRSAQLCLGLYSSYFVHPLSDHALSPELP